MAAKMKNSNFYARLTEKQERPSKSKDGVRGFLPSIVLGALCIVVFAVFAGLNIGQQVQLNKLNTWINDTANVQQYTEAVTKQMFLTFLNAKQEKVDNTINAIATYPAVEGETFRTIEAAGGEAIVLSFSSYDASTGILEFYASSEEVLDIPQYVRMLESTNLFHSVTYTGYGFDEAEETYNINVSCIMRAANQGE